jgi:hypothetical protein
LKSGLIGSLQRNAIETQNMRKEHHLIQHGVTYPTYYRASFPIRVTNSPLWPMKPATPDEGFGRVMQHTTTEGFDPTRWTPLQ